MSCTNLHKMQFSLHLFKANVTGVSSLLLFIIKDQSINKISVINQITIVISSVFKEGCNSSYLSHRDPLSGITSVDGCDVQQHAHQMGRLRERHMRRRLPSSRR